VPGRRFTVAEAQPPALDGEYLIVETVRRFRDPRAAGAGQDVRPDIPAFLVELTAIPAEQEFRPPALTPRPRVSGKELAVVTGPPGEEIHVDEYGRIKVHFYWDREGQIDDKASFWIRVQQQNTSGSMMLPRVGWEVDVAFLDGDPDRPVVMQRLYNRETMPPYGLPDNKSQSSLQSSSSPGGGGTNEVRLQDSASGMEFFVHASKDFALKAGHDMTETVAVDVHEEVGLKLQTNIAGNESSKVGSNQSLSVTGELKQETTGSKATTVGAADDWGVTGAYTLSCEGNRSDDIGGLMNVLANRVTETFNSNLTRKVGAALSINSAGSIAEVVGGNKSETVGGAKLELVRQGKAEQVTGTKTLTSGAMIEKVGKDIQMSAEAALAITVGGPIVEKVGEGFTLGAEAVVITAAGGAELKVGGTKLTARGGSLKVNAPDMGASGGPMLQIKGKVNYK
jgi:type VI secretion system secreted protein VgrG